MTLLKSNPSMAASRLVSAAGFILPSILAGDTISRRLMNTAMADAFGGRSADGFWGQRESFQMLEIAVLKAVRKMAISSDPAAALDALAHLEARLPTQTVRSEEQIALQHFSTPLALSWLVGRIASIAADDVVLEPSADTGMLRDTHIRPCRFAAAGSGGG